MIRPDERGLEHLITEARTVVGDHRDRHRRHADHLPGRPDDLGLLAVGPQVLQPQDALGLLDRRIREDSASAPRAT
ncbi:MAG TPA: hypothetical protein VGM75_00450 [Pseudonocardiaceae bacterium]|jgi:hypothetical protein